MPTFEAPVFVYAYGQQLIATAETYSNALLAQASELIAPVINPSFPTITAPPTPGVALQPTLEAVTWNVPVEPAAFSGSISLSGLLVGPYTGIAPTLSFATAPASFSTAAPPAPGVNTNFTYPTLTGLAIPSAPTLLSLDVVAFNPLVIPTFTGTVPTLTANAPNGFNYTENALFTSALLTSLETDLNNAITTGTGLSLPNAAQQALMDAAYEREYRTVANALAELDRMETLGYAFPTGAFIDARLKIQTELNYTMSGVSREIMATQYKTQLDNLVAARQAATALEGKLIDYANQIAQRAFEAAKASIDAAIAIYNAQVEAYKASLEGFRSQVLVYETEIKGIEAQIRETQAQIDFEKTKAEINTTIVDQYKVEIDAQNLLVEIYKAQLEAIQIQANVQKTVVDLYGAQIQAYVGQVNAYTAQVEGYKASVETQGVIENVYKTNVEAYSATVNASVAQINAQVAVFRGQIDAYTAQLQGYDSAIKGMVGQAQAAAEYNTAAAEVFKGQVAAVTSYNGTLTAQWQAVLNEQEKIAEVGVAAAKANGDLFIAARGLSLDASKVAAQVSAQLGAAALGAVHYAENANYSVSDATQEIKANNTNNNTSFTTSSSDITEEITSN